MIVNGPDQLNHAGLTDIIDVSTYVVQKYKIRYRVFRYK